MNDESWLCASCGTTFTMGWDEDLGEPTNLPAYSEVGDDGHRVDTCDECWGNRTPDSLR